MNSVSTGEWVDYQPHRNREKAFHDIRLRDGSVRLCCWPNSDVWNPWDGKGGNPIKDYRVVSVRRCEPVLDL